MKQAPYTRRDFMKVGGCAAMGVAIGFPVLSEKKQPQTTLSKVVLVRHPDATDAKGQANEQAIQSMLDQGITELFDVKTPAEAWRKIIRPDDIVGIKSNVWRPLPTPAKLEQAIQLGVIGAGVRHEHVAVDDRGVLGHPVFEKATALINVRPSRTHAWSGVGSLLKNYIMFVPSPPDYHANACADLGALWRLPLVKNKTRLNILVVLTPQFHGIGPHHFDKSYTWGYNGLLLGTDPVAVDTVGLRLLQLKRQQYFGEDRPLKPSAHHIAFADTRYHLGTSDPAQIDLIKMGWEKDVLL